MYDDGEIQYDEDLFPKEPCMSCGDIGSDWYQLLRQDNMEGTSSERLRSWWVCKECARKMPDILDVLMERL